MRQIKMLLLIKKKKRIKENMMMKMQYHLYIPQEQALRLYGRMKWISKIKSSNLSKNFQN